MSRGLPRGGTRAAALAQPDPTPRTLPPICSRHSLNARPSVHPARWASAARCVLRACCSGAIRPQASHPLQHDHRAGGWGDNKWEVTYTQGSRTQTEAFDGVLVCTGRHGGGGFIPQFKNQDQFRGQIMHSSQYKVRRRRPAPPPHPRMSRRRTWLCLNGHRPVARCPVLPA